MPWARPGTSAPSKANCRRTTSQLGCKRTASTHKQQNSQQAAARARAGGAASLKPKGYLRHMTFCVG